MFHRYEFADLGHAAQAFTQIFGLPSVYETLNRLHKELADVMNRNNKSAELTPEMLRCAVAAANARPTDEELNYYTIFADRWWEDPDGNIYTGEVYWHYVRYNRLEKRDDPGPAVVLAALIVNSGKPTLFVTGTNATMFMRAVDNLKDFLQTKDKVSTQAADWQPDANFTPYDPCFQDLGEHSSLVQICAFASRFLKAEKLDCINILCHSSFHRGHNEHYPIDSTHSISKGVKRIGTEFKYYNRFHLFHDRFRQSPGSPLQWRLTVVPLRPNEILPSGVIV